MTLLDSLFGTTDPFKKIARGKNRGKYRSPSGRVFTKAQVQMYYARGGSFDECRCRDSHEDLTCDAARKARRDPTMTLDLRRGMIRELERRWRSVQRLLTASLVTQDLFGVSGNTVASLQISAGAGGQHQAFQNFVDQTLQQVVLGADRGEWISKYVVPAYVRGWERIAQHVGRTDLQPIRDRADLLVKSSIAELQGVMEATSQNLVRVFADGLIAHQRAGAMARLMRRRIEAIGTVRSRAMAQFMIVKANNEAALDLLTVAGHQKVSIIPETLPPPGRRAPIRDFGSVLRLADAPRRGRRSRPQLFEVVTAGDDDVCPICEGIEEDGPYTLAEARGLIPAHPNCRCAYWPYGGVGDAASVVDVPVRRSPFGVATLKPPTPAYDRVGYWLRVRDSRSAEVRETADALLAPCVAPVRVYRGVSGLLPREGMVLIDDNYSVASVDAADLPSGCTVLAIDLPDGLPCRFVRDGAVVLPRSVRIVLEDRDEETGFWKASVSMVNA